MPNATRCSASPLALPVSEPEDPMRLALSSPRSGGGGHNSNPNPPSEAADNTDNSSNEDQAGARRGLFPVFRKGAK